jgi:DNA-binding NarL/FixJ family response regulator
MNPPEKKLAPDSPLRVFLVDDHEVARAGVRSLIGTQVEIVGEADEVEAAIELIQERDPDVVLVDVHMPGGGGKRIVDAVTPTNPDTVFLALSVSDAPEDVIDLIRSGARGYLTKDVSGAELLTAIRRVAAGEAVFSPRLAGFVLETFSSFPVAEVDADIDRLTQKEQEVMRLIARGYTYKEVAERLYVSPKTIEKHVSSVLRKLRLSNRHELTRWAFDRGLS